MNIFKSVRSAKVPKTNFNLTHDRKLSFKFGQLIPILAEEVVPGDKFNITTELMIRLAPMVSPVMHRINAYVHFFYVPNRLVDDDWEDMITGNADISAPQIQLSRIDPSSLYDYMGLPTMAEGTVTVNAHPFRAYNLIYNEYYRDQDLQDEIKVKDALNGDFIVRLRNWEKDYFTSARPWAQKGDPVTIPVEHTTETRYIGEDETNTINTGDTIQFLKDSGNEGWLISQGNNVQNFGLDLDQEIDINNLRTAVRIQRWLERNARAGSRYVEHLLAHWGVKPQDARLNRPEYIGGGKQPVVISEVLNTSDTANAAQGEMAGHGITVGSENKGSYYCPEHGYIIGILSVKPKTAYYQGVHRKFSRKTKFDYYFPEFARLGEQEIKNKEIYLNGGIGNNDEGTFGYQGRYSEYKYGFNTVHGDFRNTLDFWHMGRRFASLPPLNGDFVKIDEAVEDLDNIFAVKDGTDYLWCQLVNRIQAIRPMPYFNDPTL